MHKIAEGEINATRRPTVLLSHTDEIEISEIAKDEADPPENHQDNGTTPPVNTQPSPLH